VRIHSTSFFVHLLNAQNKLDFFAFNVFILFHNANIVHFSSIKNFNKHVLIYNFHFNCETRIKEKLLNWAYKKSQSGQIISLPMQCYNTISELQCHVIIIKRFLVVR
jgi:hypothetical protein